MSNLFTRIVKAVKDEINQTFEEKDINPSEMFTDFLKSCEMEIAKIEALIKRQDHITSRFHKERDEAAAKAKKRRRQAEVAERANESELQNRALEDAIYYENLVKSLEAKCEKAELELVQLRDNLNEMRKKIKEINLEQLEQMSRENIAHISKRLKNAYEKFTAPVTAAPDTDDLDEKINEIKPQGAAFEAADEFDEKIVQLEKELEERE